MSVPGKNPPAAAPVAKLLPSNETKPMFREGTYAAWFKTQAGEGTGIAHLDAGGISGGDSILTYSGCYEIEGDRITAVVRTKRHTTGHPSIFGIDEMTLRLAGKCGETLITLTGHADEAPEMLFEATLMLSQPEERRPRREPSPDDYHPERLPTPLPR
ncbi:hypothetical protein [Bradyrhizobium sp. STM 3557]|uniref:hypothetical protein n=1 Tax=Bradyrhizobium sp. STM 3557 TaxID=578920 RepID=UPI00389083BE